MKLPGIKGFDQEAFNKYLKNTGLSMLGKVGSLAIKMLVNVVLVANYLGAFKNGVLNGAVVYVTLFAAVASLGLDQFIVKELHARPKDRDVILGTAFRMKFTAGLLSIPVIFLAWQFFRIEDTPSLFILIVSFMGVLQSFTVIDAYFQAEVQSKYIMQVQIGATLLSAAIKVLLIFMQCSIVFFIYAYLLDFLWIAAGYAFMYNRKGRKLFNWKFDKALSRRLLSQSWPLIISGIMVSLYMRIDQLMLHKMMGAEAQGIYTTAVNFSEAWYFMPSVIVTTLFPAILNARRDDPERYQKRLQNLYDLMVWFSVAAAVLISFISPVIYHYFKPEFAKAAPVLSVHVWSAIFVFLGTANGQYLIAEDLSKLAFVRNGIGAAANIVLNLIFIPSMGIMGAAVATLISYFISTFFIIFIPGLRQQAVMMLKSLFLISLVQKIREQKARH